MALKRNQIFPSLSRRQFVGGALVSSFASPSQADSAKIAQNVSNLTKGKPVTELRGLVPNGSEANLLPIIKEWREITGIDVTLESTSVDQVNDRITLDALVGRNTYDFALPATFSLPDLVWADAIQSLEPFEKRALELRSNDVGLYDLGERVNGSRYGFQTDGDVYLMFYRRDLLENPEYQTKFSDEFGVKLETPRTWEELDRAIRFFNDQSGVYGGALFRTPAYLAWEFWLRIHAKGLLPFDEEFNPNLESELAAEALAEMISISQCLHPETATAGLFENWKLFSRENIFCNIGWGGSQKYFNRPGSPLRGQLQFASPPFKSSQSLSYFNWGWSYVIPKGAKEPEIAHQFARFAISPEPSTLAVREADGFFDPFRTEHYQDPMIADVYSKPFLAQHREAMKSALPDLYLPGRGDYFSSLSRNLAAALAGDISPKQAMADTALDWRLTTSEFGKQSQLTQWNELTSVYPAALRPEPVPVAPSITVLD